MFVAVFGIYPLLELFRMSVSTVGFANILDNRWPFVGFDNFSTLFDSPTFSEALTNTLIFVTLVVSISVVGGMAAALALRAATLPRRLTLALLVFVWTLPPVVSGSVWRFLFSSEGVVNEAISRTHIHEPVFWLSDPSLSLYSVAFVNAWAALPFAALVLRAGLMGIPPQTMEAAAVDGASGWRTFWYVTLPQLRPVVLVLIVLITVYAFRSFDFIFIMTLGGPGTSSTTLPYLAYQQAFTLGFFDLGAAVAVIAGLFVAVTAAFYVRLTRREAHA